MNHFVLFDGTPDRPWGRHLSVAPDPIRPAPSLRPPKPETLCARVLELVREDPGTTLQIASRLGITRDQAVHALSELRDRGDVESGETAFAGSRTVYRAVIR